MSDEMNFRRRLRLALAGPIVLGLLHACSDGGTSLRVGDPGVDGTPSPTLPSNEGPILRGSVGSGTGAVRDETRVMDPYSIAALFSAAGLGNVPSLGGAIDDRGLPTSTAGSITVQGFTLPPTWPPPSAAGPDSLPLPDTLIATSYAGAFDPSAPPDQAWTANWTVALDGTLSRFRFFGFLAPRTAQQAIGGQSADDQCPEGTTLTGRFSDRIGELGRDETGLFFNSILAGVSDYDVCRLPPRFDGGPETGGTLPLLTNDNVYELADSVGTYVGEGDADRTSLPEPAAVSLGIEAGTLIFGEAGESLIVSRGSRIEAAGRPMAPITLTSLAQLQARFDGDFGTAATGASGGWGGLVLMGRAPNQACVAASCDVVDEGAGRHGGEVPDDSSGAFDYVLIRNGGGGLPGAGEGGSPRASLRLLSTGRATRIDHLQVHGGANTGVIIDGGSSFLTHLAITTQRLAPSLAARAGWTGGLQHLLVIPAADTGAGLELGSGESAGSGANPVSFPLLANLTVLGPAGGASEVDQALLLRGGTRAQIWNSIFSGNFPGGCLDLDDAETFARSAEAGGAPPERPGPHLLFRNSVVDCAAVNFNENG
ncbi:MAG: hypothetical protein ACT4QA_00365 [Panacagrimonas sp.]